MTDASSRGTPLVQRLRLSAVFAVWRAPSSAEVELLREAALEIERLQEIVARCAADTTAPDLAQTIEFMKAEHAHRVEVLVGALREARPYVFNQACVPAAFADWRSQTADDVLARVDAALKGAA